MGELWKEEERGIPGLMSSGSVRPCAVKLNVQGTTPPPLQTMSVLRGHEGRAPSQGSKFFQFHAVFGILSKLYVGIPTKDWIGHCKRMTDRHL